MKPTVDDIDALLPQTQCGQCDYAGCKPYAKAIIEEGETINKCIPGGVKTLKRIGDYLQQPTSHLEAKLQQKEKPAVLAIIDESLCIGCTKCIKACPVDAILGRNKHMHTVISDECTGCELCVEPCPMDCIELRPVEANKTEKQQHDAANKARKRYQNRNQRLERIAQEKKQKHQQARAAKQQATHDDPIAARKAYIEQACKRAQDKRQQRNSPKSLPPWD